MELIKPSIEVWGECPMTPRESIQHMEKCGRICYKSEDKITDTSAFLFVRNCYGRGHMTILEKSNVVFRTENSLYGFGSKFHMINAETVLRDFLRNRIRYHTIVDDGEFTFISGSIRAWLETFEGVIEREVGGLLFNSLLSNFFVEYGAYLPLQKYEDLVSKVPAKAINLFEMIVDPKLMPNKMRRITVKFICDRGISHEIVRHRPCSFLQESTRYVNYRTRGMKFIIPFWCENLIPGVGVEECFTKDVTQPEVAWSMAMAHAEDTYNKLTGTYNWRPEEARSVLPNSLKTEILVTADIKEWSHIFKLRCDKKAHPQMRELMEPLAYLFHAEGWI